MVTMMMELNTCTSLQNAEKQLQSSWNDPWLLSLSVDVHNLYLKWK